MCRQVSDDYIRLWWCPVSRYKARIRGKWSFLESSVQNSGWVVHTNVCSIHFLHMQPPPASPLGFQKDNTPRSNRFSSEILGNDVEAVGWMLRLERLV